METLKLIKEYKQGGKAIYPNCDTSRLLQQLIGKNSRGKLKTFKQSDLEILNKLGYGYTLELERKTPK